MFNKPCLIELQNRCLLILSGNDGCASCFSIEHNIENELILKLVWRKKLCNRSAALTSCFAIRLGKDVDHDECLLAVTCSSAGNVIFFNPKNGTEIQETILNDVLKNDLHDGSHILFSSPVILSDKIYFGARDNFLYCLHI